MLNSTLRSAVLDAVASSVRQFFQQQAIPPVGPVKIVVECVIPFPRDTDVSVSVSMGVPKDLKRLAT